MLPWEVSKKLGSRDQHGTGMNQLLATSHTKGVVQESENRKSHDPLAKTRQTGPACPHNWFSHTPRLSRAPDAQIRGPRNQQTVPQVCGSSQTWLKPTEEPGSHTPLHTRRLVNWDCWCFDLRGRSCALKCDHGTRFTNITPSPF